MSHLLPADMCLKGMSHHRPQLTMGNSRDSVGRARGCLIRAAALVLGAQGRNRPGRNGQETRTSFGKTPHILQSLSPAFCPLLWTQASCLASTQLGAGAVAVNTPPANLQEQEARHFDEVWGGAVPADALCM